MNHVSIFCIGFSGCFLLAGAVLFFLSRRNSSSRQSFDSSRDRAVMDERGDRVIWEMGQGFPLVDKGGDTTMLERRVFFSRAVLGIFGTFVGWRMARGSTDTALLKKIAEVGGSGTPNKLKGSGPSSTSQASAGEEREMAFLQDQSHGDSHNDFPLHTDNMISHQDSMIRGAHYDVPHNDQTGHIDVHSDSSSGNRL
jgi:hypothetical protein